MSRVIVITGASSGMGRAAALKLARQGDRVVVAARRGGALEQLARECAASAGESMAVAVDVAAEGEVERLVSEALARFGRIDAWVHTAAVAAFGRFWETPTSAMRRVVEVDLFGSMLVARAAVRQFLQQERPGTLVLVSSVLGKTPIPYLSVYNSAKHGVVGLATSLRADLRDAGLSDRVHVVNLMPPSTDTPFYSHAANYTGRLPRPPPPAYSVDTLAEAIVGALDDPTNEEVTVGAMGKLMRFAHGVAPGLYETATGPYSESMFFDATAPRSDGSLFEPMAAGVTPEGPLGKRKEREA